MAFLVDLYQYGELSAPVFIPTAVVAPDLSWQPEYPDRIVRERFLPDRQQFYAANITPEQTIARAWAPNYPDTIDRLTVHPSRIPSEFEPPFSVRALGHIGWEPEYPDRIHRFLFGPEQLPALTWSTFTPGAAAPDFFQPIYQDWIARQLPQQPQSDVAPPFSVSSLGHVGWLPSFPDWLQLRVAQPASGESAPPSSVQPLGHSGWEPEYPDQIWRVTLPTAAQQVSAFNPFPIVAFPSEFLTWQAIYPDKIYPTAGLSKDLQQWLALDPFPRPNAPAPDLSWDPEYPDQIFRIALPLGVPFTWRNVEPIVVASPDLAWKPVYPDQIWVKQLYSAHLTVFVTRLDAPAETVLSSWEPAYPNFVWRAVLPTAMREGNSIAAAIEQAVAPLKWDPRMPTRLDPKRLPIALYPSFFEGVPGELIAIGQRMAWKFHEPEWLRKSPPLVHGEAFYTIPPFVPAAEHECVELVDDSFGVPALINQIFTVPSLLDEGLTVPKIIEQDLC